MPGLDLGIQSAKNYLSIRSLFGNKQVVLAGAGHGMPLILHYLDPSTSTLGPCTNAGIPCHSVHSHMESMQTTKKHHPRQAEHTTIETPDENFCLGQPSNFLGGPDPVYALGLLMPYILHHLI